MGAMGGVYSKLDHPPLPGSPGPDIEIPMRFRLRLLTEPVFRRVWIALACAAAGGMLRWINRETSLRAGSDRAPAAAKPGSKHSALTAVRLLSMPAKDGLESIAAQLPHLKLEEIDPLVRKLAHLRPEFGSKTEAVDALLYALCTRWAELDGRGMMNVFKSSAFGFAPGARRIAVSALAELRGIEAVKDVAREWPAIARRVAWEVLRRQPQDVNAIIPWLGGKVGWKEFSDSGELETSSLKPDLGPEQYARLTAALGREGAGWFDFARQDLPRALEGAKELPPGRVRDAAMEIVMREYSRSESGGSAGLSFRSEYEALPEGKVRDALAGDYARLVASENPETALKWARSLPAAKVRGEALGAIAREMQEAAPPGNVTRLFAEALLENPHSNQGSARESFQAWLSAEPKIAESWFQNETDPRVRAVLAPVLLSIPGHDLSVFPFFEERLTYVWELLSSDHNPESTGDEPVPASRPAVPAEYARAVRLMVAAASGVSDQEWTGADIEGRRFLSASAIQHRADGIDDENPAATAAGFFDTMSPAERSLEAWYEGSKAKIRADMNGAAGWIESLKQGQERDAAVTGMIDYLLTEKEMPDVDDARAALGWAAGMSGTVERLRYVSEAAEALAQQDPGAARSAIEAANLADDEKHSILNRLEKGETP